MIKKILKKRDQITVREQILWVILAFSIASTLVTLMMGSISGLSKIVILERLFVLIMSLVSVVLVYKYDKLELAATIMAGSVNCILLPVVFFATGGVEGGAIVWFIFGAATVYLLFSGKKRFIFLTITYSVCGITLYISYNNPDMIKEASLFERYISAGWAVVVVGIIIGMFIKFQKKGYEKEFEIAQQKSVELENLSRSQSAFFANMSHEIRTPINTIIGLNEMILREDISDEIAENAINIQNASKMLLVLINDILDLSKLESGKMEIVPVQYETGALFSDLVNIIWVRAHNKGLEFKIDISEDIPSMLYGDEVRIKQILTNILTNAVKYTQKGSVTLSVKSENLGNNNVLLRISVEDTGMGIKKESLKDLFSAFKRVDEDKNRNIEGTGLGLSISKQLVDMMGGEITVDSIYTKGSIFTVSIEQKIVNTTPVGAVDLLIKKKINDRPKYQQSFEAPEVKVLVVDDNEMNLMVAKKLLRETKIQVDLAKSGKECLEKTRTKAYHVIFMDHMMPEMDGEETLKQLKTQENGHCQLTPVVALTANVMPGAEKIYRDKGFDGYLAKPINGALLEAMLLKFLPEELVEYSNEAGENQGKNTMINMISHKKKKKLIITTDCVCDLPDALVEKFEIRQMYYYVHTNEGRFCDTKEISSDNLLNYLESNKNTAYSSPATVEEYESFLADVISEAEKVIHISMASKTSKGYERALTASKGFDNVTVIDSGHLSSGMGIIVLYAAKLAREGFGVEEITNKVKGMREKISTSFIIPTGENMYKNGKISKFVKVVCDTLYFHIVLSLSQSKLVVKNIEMGSIENSYKSYIKNELKNKNKIDKRILFITYAGCSIKQLEKIKIEVDKYVKFEKIIIQKCSATISSNAGIGTVGLAYIKK